MSDKEEWRAVGKRVANEPGLSPRRGLVAILTACTSQASTGRFPVKEMALAYIQALEGFIEELEADIAPELDK